MVCSVEEGSSTNPGKGFGPWTAPGWNGAGVQTGRGIQLRELHKRGDKESHATDIDLRASTRVFPRKV